MQAPYLPNVSMLREDLPPQVIPAMLQSYTRHLKEVALFDEKDFSLLPGITITHCVCIGLGNFTRPFSHLKSGDHAACLGQRNDSLLQLAALTIILELLGKTQPVEKVYFQDPDFTNFEKWFLRGLGYDVLDDPEAFNLVDSTTFLFAPVVSHEVWVKALEHGSPALYIGNCVDWTIANVSELDFSYGSEEKKATLKTFCRFRKETVAQEIPFCDRYWLGNGSARVLIPKGKTSIGSEKEDRIEVGISKSGV